ncbi:hypothetical protein KCP71_11205 [Salmonella enterica subsp. enterica]|nr:hypothetical protein KCP71_11205 [Salmonella enterica subsp. enterica]
MAGADQSRSMLKQRPLTATDTQRVASLFARRVNRLRAPVKPEFDSRKRYNGMPQRNRVPPLTFTRRSSHSSIFHRQRPAGKRRWLR